jgi:hypothetical protein
VDGFRSIACHAERSVLREVKHLYPANLRILHRCKEDGGSEVFVIRGISMAPGRPSCWKKLSLRTRRSSPGEAIFFQTGDCFAKERLAVTSSEKFLKSISTAFCAFFRSDSIQRRIVILNGAFCAK